MRKKYIVEVGMVISELTVKEIKGGTAVCECSCGKFPVNRRVTTLESTLRNILTKNLCRVTKSCCSDCKNKSIRSNRQDLYLKSIPDHTPYRVY